MVGNWRWPMVCRSSTGHNWQTANDGGRLKTRTCPELTGEVGRARLVVLATEVGGRWSNEIQVFLRQSAQSESQSRTSSFPGSSSSCLVAQVAHCSGMLHLLEFRGGLRCDGPNPTTSGGHGGNSATPGFLCEAAGVVRVGGSLS